MKTKICIVVSKFNGDITAQIQDSAVYKLKDKGIKDKYLKVIYVEGAFEIPYAISKLIKKYDGFIAVGCIIKGETPNFDFISQAITNGIITCLNRKQALERADPMKKNKGGEAAKAALSVLGILNEDKR